MPNPLRYLVRHFLYNRNKGMPSTNHYIKDKYLNSASFGEKLYFKQLHTLTVLI